MLFPMELVLFNKQENMFRKIKNVGTSIFHLSFELLIFFGEELDNDNDILNILLKK